MNDISLLKERFKNFKVLKNSSHTILYDRDTLNLRPLFPNLADDLTPFIENIDFLPEESSIIAKMATIIDYLASVRIGSTQETNQEDFEKQKSMTDAGGGTNYGPDTGGTGGNCKSEGSNCGGGCEAPTGPNGSSCGTNCGGETGNDCGTNCGGGCGGNCKPFTDNLAENAFLVNFNENMMGTDIYVVELINHYKANIIQQVATQLLRSAVSKKSCLGKACFLTF